MPNKDNTYCFVDINLTSMQVVGWGETNTANLTGATEDPNVFRLFLTKGQYNKLTKHLR
jgi:hypothetical protein